MVEDYLAACLLIIHLFLFVIHMFLFLTTAKSNSFFNFPKYLYRFKTFRKASKNSAKIIQPKTPT